MQYKVVLEESEEGFAVSVPGLPGCHSQGMTERAAPETLADALRAYLAASRERCREARMGEDAGGGWRCAAGVPWAWVGSALAPAAIAGTLVRVM